MKKLYTILFSSLLWIMLCFWMTACAVVGGDNSSASTSDDTSVEDSSASTSDDTSVEDSSTSTSDDTSVEDSSSTDEQEEYTITYDLGVVKGNPDVVITSTTQAVYYNETFTLYTPTCEPYKFLYWTVEGETEPFTAMEYPFEESITLVANWKVPYYITYTLGAQVDADIDRTQELVYYGEEFAMPTPTCEPYKFLYWTVEGETEPFTATEYPFEESITLVAQWRDFYYITYDLGVCKNNPNATIDKTEERVYYGAEFTMPKPTCPSYTFLYWTVEGESTSFVATAYPFRDDVTLVAKWREPYYITYELGDRAGDKDAKITTTRQRIYYGDSMSLEKPTCGDYLFTGWTRKDTGESFSGNTYLLEESITLVANWKAPYYITYDLGYLEGSDLVTVKPQKQLVYHDELFSITIPAVSNHQFVCWQEQVSGDTVTGGKYAYERDITLVAVWAPYTLTYKVYDVDGTSLISTTTKNVNYGEKVTLEQPTPPKGYEFVGWEIEGTNTRIADAVYEYTHENDIVLVAVWQEREFSEFE